MGHIRLGTLPQSKKWREGVVLLNSDAPLQQIAQRRQTPQRGI